MNLKHCPSSSKSFRYMLVHVADYFDLYENIVSVLSYFCHSLSFCFLMK